MVMSLAITPLLPPPPDPVPEAEAKPIPEVAIELARASAPAFEPAPQAVITESAEAIYVNDRKDTVEAPPLAVAAVACDIPTMPAIEVTPPPMVVVIPPLEAEAAPAAAAAPVTEAAGLALDATVPVEQAKHERDEEPRKVDTHSDERAIAAAKATADMIAAERGVAPIRVPSVSQAFVALRVPSARKLVAGSLTVAGISIGIAVAAVIWARGAVADAENAAAAARAHNDVAPAPAPSMAPSTAPAEQLAPTAAPVDQPQAMAKPMVDEETEARGPAPTTCSVIVSASSEGATVWVDGASRGLAPATITGACDTTVQVEVRHPRYAVYQRELVLAGNLELDAQLERQKTELTVWSEPAGVEVIYDGQKIGRTPLTTKVNRYEQGHMYFRAPGYETDWRRVVPKEAKKTVAITLKKAR